MLYREIIAVCSQIYWRYHTLTEHIAQAEAYSKHTAVYKRYAELKGEKQDAYFERHSKEIVAFSKAHEYMTRHLNGRTKIPLDEWKREFAALSKQRDTLLAESDILSQELRSAEVIKRNAEKVMGVSAPKRNKTQSMEL